MAKNYNNSKKEMDEMNSMGNVKKEADYRNSERSAYKNSSRNNAKDREDSAKYSDRY